MWNSLSQAALNPFPTPHASQNKTFLFLDNYQAERLRRNVRGKGTVELYLVNCLSLSISSL